MVRLHNETYCVERVPSTVSMADKARNVLRTQSLTFPDRCTRATGNGSGGTLNNVDRRRIN